MFWNTMLIWMALSAREPNITPNPYDYEISTGWKTDQGWFKTDGRLLWERENGAFYIGRIHNYDAKYVFVGEYVKEAKEINQQKIIAKVPVKYKWATFEYGGGAIFKEYKDPEFTLFHRIKTKYVEIEVSSFDRLHFASAKAKYNWTHKSGIFIEPIARYYMADEKRDWQGKIKVGYNFSQKFGKVKMK